MCKCKQELQCEGTCVKDTPQIDWSKPLQLRDGTPVRLLGVLAGSASYSHVVAGVFISSTVGEDIIYVHADGSRSRLHESKWDVINVPPPKQKAWTVLYVSENMPCSVTYKVRENAEAFKATFGYHKVEIKEWEY